MADVILTNLSSIYKGRNYPEYLYKSDAGMIKGVYTNDAPVKFLISDLKSKGRKAGKIIAVATNEADTSYDAFCEMLSEYANEIGVEIPKPKKIHTSESTIAETIQNIVNEISLDDNIYIDTTGGFRNSSYLLMGVVRVLEYSNIRLEKAVYSKLVKENTDENEIEDVTSLYRMFDLINAVHTFSSVGNSHELEEYFKNCDNETIRRTIDAMNVFSDEITLCRTSKLNDALRQLNSCLSELSDLRSDSRDITLFKSLADVIRSKFNVQNGEIEYPAVVKWCLDNRLIQQAVTVYVEKMPEYFYKKGYFTVTDSQLEIVRKKNEKSTFGLYYELFYSNLMQDNYFPKFVMLLKKISEKTKSNPVISGFSSKAGKSEEEIILDALNECENKSAFLNRFSDKSSKKSSKKSAKNPFEKYGFESMKKDLQSFFDVRNAIYVNNGFRDVCLRNEKLENYPEVMEILNAPEYNLPQPKQFINFLLNQPKLMDAIFSIKREYESKQLTFIENITNYNGFSDYKLTDKLSVAELQQLFRDIYYMKTFVRNNLNHASEDENNNEEVCSYFAKYNYRTDNELDVEYVRQLLYKSLENLKIGD